MIVRRGRWPQLAVVCVLLAAYAALSHYCNSRLGSGHSRPAVARGFAWFNFLQDTGLDALLGLSFAQSLRKRRIPLCTALADRVHGPLSSAEIAYTRLVTVAWGGFFFALLAISSALFVFGPLSSWSLFANLCALPLIGVMFIVESAVRRRVLPQGCRPGIFATMQVYLRGPR